MFKFFDAILSFVETIVLFVWNMFQLLITVVVNITRAVAWLFLCIGYLPPWLTAMPTASPSHAVSQSS